MAFKYLQLAAQLQAEIARGTFPDKLPTEQELTRLYSVSRQTVRQALDKLVELGLIEKRQGSGSRVLDRGRSGGSDRVAVVTSYLNDYIFPTVLQDIQAVLSRKNYATLLFSTQNKVSNERDILQGLLHQPVGGLIVEGSKTALPNPNLDLYEKLDLAGIPVVFIHGSYESLPGAVCVSDDNFGGGYQLARHLITRGHTGVSDRHAGRRAAHTGRPGPVVHHGGAPLPAGLWPQRPAEALYPILPQGLHGGHLLQRRDCRPAHPHAPGQRPQDSGGHGGGQL